MGRGGLFATATAHREEASLQSAAIRSITGNPGSTHAAVATVRSMHKELDIMGLNAPRSTYSTMAQEIIGTAVEAIEHFWL